MYENMTYDYHSMGFIGAMGPFGMLIGVLLVILPFWFIFSKAGYSGWVSLLMLVPIINIIAIYFLAFSDWPALKRKDHP